MMITLRWCSALALSITVLTTVPALAHGDKVIPQVADGNGDFRTKFDITNLSPVERITLVKLLFFRQDGTPWLLDTNQGRVSEITLNLGRFQTIRIETSAKSPSLTAGYAIVRNSEATSNFAEDFEVAVTVFYEVLDPKGAVVDTVSVPSGDPTKVWVFPVETDVSAGLLTGFAVVNNTGQENAVSLRLWEAGARSDDDALDGGTVTFTLSAGEQRARFLNENSLFPNKTRFKGMLVGSSEGPVSILALLQTTTSFGVQYATMVPVYADTIRRNTYMYLRQGFPLDADIPVSDYYGNSDDSLPWDLLYVTESATQRVLQPQLGASVSVIGTRTDVEFDGITLETLRGLTYTTADINLSDGSANLAQRLVFAVKTALGRYVKIRIAEIFTRETTNRDLALEIYVFK